MAERAAPVEKVERWPIGKLLPYARNPKTHPPEQVDLIAKSMERFGQAQIILIDGDEGPTNGEVIAGHGRVLAAEKLGWDSLVVGEARGWSEEEKKSYRIADNQLGMIAPFDMSKLKLEMQDLSLAKFDMGVLGFAAPQLFELLAAEPAVDAKAEEAPPLPKRPVVEVGDLWALGHHRLLCGDVRNEKEIERLMGGSVAQLIFTDPPYGVDYDGGTKKRKRLEGDDSTALYDPACHMSARFSDGKAALYLWHAGVKGIAAAAAAAAMNAGYEIRCELIWNKNQAQFGSLSAQYKQKHDPIYYCHKRGKSPRWFGPTNEITVWDHNRSSSNEFHPTQKPVAVAERAIKNSTLAGDIVLDFFLGSGSTMIAAEVTARRCLAMDIDPGYVQVAIERWQTFAGKEATLDGKSFAAVKAERLRSRGRSRKVDRPGVSDHSAKNGKRRSRLDAKRKGGSTSAAPT